MSTFKIGKSCTPSTILSHDLINVTKIKVTFGGGMGGANMNLYCTSIEDIENGFKKLNLITGDTMNVNSNFIVYTKKGKIVKLISDITAHLNAKNKSSNSKQVLKIEYIKIFNGENYEIVDNFQFRNDISNRMISTTDVF
jgi:hypothetical protein